MTAQLLRSTARTWFWFVLGGTLLGAVIAFGVAVIAAPSYTARVTILVTPASTGVPITNGDLQLAQGLTPTFAELATTKTVLDRVISATKVSTDSEHLALDVTTHVPVGTSLLTIGVSNPDPGSAAALANAIATELSTYAAPTGGDASAALQVELNVVDPATPPVTRDGPGLAVRIALGGAIALFLTISIAFLVENVGRGAQTIGRDIETLGRGSDSLGRPAGGWDSGASPADRGGFGSTSETFRSPPGVGFTPAAGGPEAGGAPTTRSKRRST